MEKIDIFHTLHSIFNLFNNYGKNPADFESGTKNRRPIYRRLGSLHHKVNGERKFSLLDTIGNYWIKIPRHRFVLGIYRVRNKNPQQSQTP